MLPKSFILATLVGSLTPQERKQLRLYLKRFSSKQRLKLFDLVASGKNRLACHEALYPEQKTYCNAFRKASSLLVRQIEDYLLQHYLSEDTLARHYLLFSLSNKRGLRRMARSHATRLATHLQAEPMHGLTLGLRYRLGQFRLAEGAHRRPPTTQILALHHVLDDAWAYEKTLLGLDLITKANKYMPYAALLEVQRPSLQAAITSGSTHTNSSPVLPIARSCGASARPCWSGSTRAISAKAPGSESAGGPPWSRNY
ncbi:MAG: hypothetical protein OHK0039_19790 [Bacteroidia bacterium]